MEAVGSNPTSPIHLFNYCLYRQTSYQLQVGRRYRLSFRCLTRVLGKLRGAFILRDLDRDFGSG